MSGGTIKCLVWDLDETLWSGILLEGGGRELRPGVRETVLELDRRGILQSLASRNDRELALARLEELGLAEYFLYPQINFGVKSDSLKAVAAKLNLGLDGFAFIDDQEFERAEVAAVCPQTLILGAADVPRLLDMERFRPRFVTPDSAGRRLLYLTDQRRIEAEESFQGPTEEFLRSLEMEFSVDRVGPGDLERVVDLTERTHQLNATGLTFDHDELTALMESPVHLLLINSLRDRFGDYGRIGLSLLDKSEKHWVLKLLLMSCRVMSRGVGSIMLNLVVAHAAKAGRELYADFAETDRNRIMYVTYRFAGFEEVERRDRLARLKWVGPEIPSPPAHIRLSCGLPGFLDFGFGGKT
jgi:FkbH-like protein